MASQAHSHKESITRPTRSLPVYPVFRKIEKIILHVLLLLFIVANIIMTLLAVL